MDRPRIAGDYHGQAPILWCAYALLNNKKKPVLSVCIVCLKEKDAPMNWRILLFQILQL